MHSFKQNKKAPLILDMYGTPPVLLKYFKIKCNKISRFLKIRLVIRL